MYFENHQAIWLFWLIPILVVAFVFFDKQRNRILAHIYSKVNLSEKLPHFNSRASITRFILFLLALICFFMAFLKLYSDFEMREVKRRGMDVFLLVDLSDSMLAQDIQPSRLLRARREISDFLKLLQGDRVGLIGFAGDSFVFVPLTSDYNTLSLFVEELSTDAIPVQGTDIKGAIEKAVNSFKSQTQNSSKAMILITDGEDSVGLEASTIEDIKKLGIKVFVLGVGTDAGAPIPLPDGGYKQDKSGKVILSKLNEAAMKSLAMATGGGYVRSVSGDLDLEEIYFQGIKKLVEQDGSETMNKKLPVYQFQIFILIGFIFLVLEILMTNKKRFWRGLFVLLILVLALPQPSYALNPFSFESTNKKYEQGDYTGALQEYSELLKKNPEDPELNYNLGNTFYRLGQYDQALDAYTKGLNSQDENIRKQSLYNSGNSLFRKNDLKGAIDYYDKALHIDKDYKAAELNKAFAVKMQEQKKQEQKQQEKDQQDKKDQENQQNQQNEQSEQNKQNEQSQDNNQQEQKNQQEQQQDSSQNQQNQNQQNEQQSQNNKLEFDKNPGKWLDSIEDKPGDALRYMIQKDLKHDQKKLEKDW